MKKIGVFYGSTSGSTENVAERIAGKLGVDSADVYNVESASVEDVDKYEALVLGSSTWGAGDMQDDWYDFLDKLKKKDLSGKLVAIFGCGDSSSFSDTFCDAIGEIYRGLESTGAKFIGSTETDGYTYDESTSVVDGKFVGLPLDEVNEEDKTDGRIDAWVEKLKKEGLQ